MRARTARHLSLGASLWLPSVGLLSNAAFAQQAASGLALDQYNPSERGSYWFANESLDLRGRGRWATGFAFDYAGRPLAIYRTPKELATTPGARVTSVVGHQSFVHVGGAATFASGLICDSLASSVIRLRSCWELSSLFLRAHSQVTQETTKCASTRACSLPEKRASLRMQPALGL